MPDQADITQLLVASRHGDAHARDELLAFIYDDLRRLAAKQLRGESSNLTLSATALVNEAWLRLVGEGGEVEFNDRAHFFRLIGRTMRRIAVDHARARLAEKRGSGERPVELDENLVADNDRAVAIMEINDLLERLGETEPRLVEVVECRFFVGMTETETADALGVSRPTVSRAWDKARQLLREMIGN